MITQPLHMSIADMENSLPAKRIEVLADIYHDVIEYNLLYSRTFLIFWLDEGGGGLFLPFLTLTSVLHQKDRSKTINKQITSTIPYGPS